VFKKPENAQEPKSQVSSEMRMEAQETNQLMEGSKVTGDLWVSSNLELGGEVTGNITSQAHSTILLRGICREGDISAGGDIEITGVFEGGEITSQGRCLINGECYGKVEAFEVELGSQAKVSGEIIYHSSIQISEGAQIEAKISYKPKDMNRAASLTSWRDSTVSQEPVCKEETPV